MYNFFLTYKVFLIFVLLISRFLMKKHIGLFIISLTLFSLGTLRGQQNSARMAEAEALYARYEFGKALEIYDSILEQTTDSLQRMAIEQKIVLCENGLSLLEYADSPTVVARECFSKEDFFLHYPGFADKSWALMPPSLFVTDSVSVREKAFVYFPEGAKSLYYSAPDENGSWNIYRVEQLDDTLWSAPAVMNENITSLGNEIFPVLSADGKSLYFSSNGHYGVGGYDLYVCEWDEESGDWGVPQNLGFPYSSPWNDYLFYNTPDGNFSVFASDRQTSGDSLVVYAVLFENKPLKKSMTPSEAEKIAELDIASSAAGQAEPDRDNLDNERYSEYSTAVENVKEVERRLDATLKKQQQSRDLYNTLTNADDLAALEKRIGELELEVIALQEELGSASVRLQQIEMEFLSQGIFLKEPENLDEGNVRQGMEPLPVFSFASNTLGRAPYMNVMEPVKPVNLAFRIESEPQDLVPVDDFPKGLVYQIQLYTLTKPVSSTELLKGLAPVFERKISGRYTYSVGAFPTYNDALSNLNKVRRLGFSSAIIRAYNDGEFINTASARALEKKIASNVLYQVVIDGYSDALPQEMLTVVRSNTNKDIAKVSDSGATRFVIGPFGSKDEAETLVAALKVVSDKTITVETVK